MADKRFTLLELHFDGDVAFSASATNNAPAIGSGSTEEETETGNATEAETDAASEESSRGIVLLGVFVLVVLLAGVARALRGGDTDLDALDELDELAEE